MNKKDRGMIKWLPFNSVISNKAILEKVINEKDTISKPIISEEEKIQIEQDIIEAYYTQNNILITYYKNGHLLKINSKIKKIDKIQKLVYLNNLILLFNQIISISAE